MAANEGTPSPAVLEAAVDPATLATQISKKEAQFDKQQDKILALEQALEAKKFQPVGQFKTPEDAKDAWKLLSHLQLKAAEELTALRQQFLAAQQLAASAGPQKVRVHLYEENKKKAVCELRSPVTYTDLCKAIEAKITKFDVADYEVKRRLPGIEKQLESIDDDWSFNTVGAELHIYVFSESMRLSDYQNKQGLEYLTGNTFDAVAQVTQAHGEFPAAKLNLSDACPVVSSERSDLELPFRRKQEVLAFLYSDLIMRVCIGANITEQSELSRRELISPTLFAAAALVGNLNIAAEYNVRGSRAHGSIDWVYIYNKLSIIVCEAKVDTPLLDHMGQLCAELKASREHYEVTVNRKRKRDEPDEALTKVPYVGILTNGSNWLFVRYEQVSKKFVRSAPMELPLGLPPKRDRIEEAAKDIVLRLVQLLKNQQEAINDMRNPKKVKSG